MSDDPRDLELAEKAVTFVLRSLPEDRIANLALLFSLARSYGKADAGKEMQILLATPPEAAQ